MIQCQAVSKIYGTAESRVIALDQVEFTIQESERVALIGKSGSGKSSLLHLLSGMDKPTSGKIVVDQQNLGDLSRAELATYRLCKIGVVFQSFQLIAQRTAFENVELPLVLKGMPRPQRLEKVRGALQSVGLEKRMHHRPNQLSGGEQQRVAIARAMMNDPKILFADEPTGNLDSKSTDQILDLLLDISQHRKVTMVLITHDQHLANRFASRTLQLVDGRMTLSPESSTPSVDDSATEVRS